MNIGHKEILEGIDGIFKRGNYYYSDYILNQLKKQETLILLQDIIAKSGKTPSEAIIVFLAAIRYIGKDLDALRKLEQNDSFSDFVNNHYHEINHISINKKVQGNIPERGFPILEIIGKKLRGNSVGVIELGASYGLIGSCLLNPTFILENKNEFIKLGYKLPENPKKICCYLGIEIDPPDKDWLLACFSNYDDTIRVNSYIESIHYNSNFQLIKASAINFSKLKEVNKFLKMNIKPIILTSFMLYQFNYEHQKRLSEEIFEFTKKFNGHWIRQEVGFKNEIDGLEYFIEWNGKKIMNLHDDKCSNWEWIK